MQSRVAHRRIPGSFSPGGSWHKKRKYLNAASRADKSGCVSRVITHCHNDFLGEDELPTLSSYPSSCAGLHHRPAPDPLSRCRSRRTTGAHHVRRRAVARQPDQSPGTSQPDGRCTTRPKIGARWSLPFERRSSLAGCGRAYCGLAGSSGRCAADDDDALIFVANPWRESPSPMRVVSRIQRR